VLLTALAAALTRLGAVDAGLVAHISRNADVTAVPTLMEAIDPEAEPATVVLDHVEAVVNRECQYVLTEFALRLPPGWQVVMGVPARAPAAGVATAAAGPTGRADAQDLAMSPDEAAALVERAAGGTAGDGAASLVELTEGWPIGLYFAALALRTGGRPVTAISSGTVDQFVDGYLRAELFAQLSPAEIEFLTRTSVVERICGPLCDAIVDGTGSARLLEDLERRNLLVIPLDRRREWYRYHHLFRDLLLAELHRREPELVGRLHLHAAAWLETNSRPDEAIEHAQLAGDADLVARLVLDRMQPVWASGRVDTALRWMTWFDQGRGIERYPAIAAHGALIFALLGQSAETERLAAIAEHAPATGTLPDGSRMGGLLAYLRAILAGTASRPCAATPGRASTSCRSPARTGPRCCIPRPFPTCSTASRSLPTRSSPMPCITPLGPGRCRWRRSIWPSGASSPPSGTTGRRSTGTSTRRCRSCGRATSRRTGPARWSTRGPAGPRYTAATWRPRGSTRRRPRDCARCWSTRSRSCRRRRCSSSPASTWDSPTPAVPTPPSGRPRTSSPTAGPGRAARAGPRPAGQP
jgi:hypothetical protein